VVPIDRRPPAICAPLGIGGTLYSNMRLVSSGWRPCPHFPFPISTFMLTEGRSPVERGYVPLGRRLPSVGRETSTLRPRASLSLPTIFSPPPFAHLKRRAMEDQGAPSRRYRRPASSAAGNIVVTQLNAVLRSQAHIGDERRKDGLSPCPTPAIPNTGASRRPSHPEFRPAPCPMPRRTSQETAPINTRKLCRPSVRLRRAP